MSLTGGKLLLFSHLDMNLFWLPSEEETGTSKHSGIILIVL